MSFNRKDLLGLENLDRKEIQTMLWKKSIIDLKAK